MSSPDMRPLYWSISAQDPLFDELRRQEHRLVDARRELAHAEREQLRPAFEAVLTAVALLIVLPAVLAVMVLLFG